LAFVLKGEFLPPNFRSICGENMTVFANSRRKLRTKNFDAYFHRKLRTLEKCPNVKKLGKHEPQHIFIGSYKKKSTSNQCCKYIAYSC